MGNRGEGGGEGSVGKDGGVGDGDGSVGGGIVGTGGVGERGGDDGGSSKVRNKDGIGEVERRGPKHADKGFRFAG